MHKMSATQVSQKSKCINIMYQSISIWTGIAAAIAKFKNFVNVRKQCDAMNEVLFYGSEDEEQNRQVGLNNLFCIYYVIVHASQTVDVCIPTLNSETISKCLLNVHQKNDIKVRIVVHNSNDLKNLQEFVECGVEVKFIISDVKLEHEFLLIDANSKDAVAIVGCLDYEVNRVNCNHDTTLLTSEEALTRNLMREFERIWHYESLEKLCRSKDI